MRRWFVFALAIVMLALSGCNVLGPDVETQLQPPRSAGEQKEIQNALDDYIGRADKTAKRYVLKYPKSGDYRSAFILRDFDGDGEEEAIAFYRKKDDTSKTHVNLLRKKEGVWSSVRDMEGYGNDIDRVAFGDIDGDGYEEMLMGWSMYSSRDRRLEMYSLKSDTLAKRDIGVYTHLVVGNITASGHDDILMINVASGQNTVSASLKAVRGDELTDLGTVRMDGDIQQFGSHHIGKLADTVNGVYIDCFKAAGTMLTELIYWNGSQLINPLYEVASNFTRQTAREAQIPSMDIDRDGEVEWPTCVRLPGYEQADVREAMWLTRWNAFRYPAFTIEEEFASVVNVADNYCLRIDETWVGRITASYDADTHTLELMDVETGMAFLAIRASYTDGVNELPAASGDIREFQTVSTDTEDGIQYRAWFNSREPFKMDMVKTRYMLTTLPA